MKKIFSISLLLFVTAVAFSQNKSDPEGFLKGRPAKEQLVTDSSGILTEDQIQALEYKLDAFNDSTSTQIAVVIIPTLGENEIADYGVKLFRAWGVGTKEHNNGVLLLIAKDERKLNITTGYGVEGALPDITCKEIIDEVIVPKFKDNDFYRGIDDGTDAIMQAVKGEYTAPEGYGESKHHYSLFLRILFWIIGIIVLLILMKTGLLWPLLNIATSIVFSSGGSSSGGGGFSGFGGGSSGGGGASGSW